MAIVARDLKFELSEDIPSHWCPEHPEFSHVATSFMAALPYLEPYFIHNIREAAELVNDPQLKAAVDGFINQEARHAQQHKRWNQLVGARYPGLNALERSLKARLAKSKQQHSLAYRMAYTAGYEAFTYQLVCFIMARRQTWFAGADPHVLGMLSWHAAEEVEHKSVAFDVFQAIHGGHLLRVQGFIAALVESHRDIHAMTRLLMETDGSLGDREAQRRLRQVRLLLLRGLVPELRHYLKPSYRPSEHSDPRVLMAWLERHRAGDDLRSITLEKLDQLAQSV
jgi:predicted metal-dependent hydrolase